MGQFRTRMSAMGNEAKKSAGQVSQLGSALRVMGAAQSASARGMNRFGVIAQQSGYQIGDFLVQVQSGTNAFVAFGQQATQVAGTLTLLGGKWLFIGSALGIAIPLLTAIGAAFMRTRSEAEQLGTTLDDVNQRISEYGELVDRVRGGFFSNEELFLANALKAAQEDLIEAQQRRGQGSRSAVIQAQAEVDAAQDLLDEFLEQRAAAAEVKREVERISDELGISVKEAEALANIGFGNIWDGAAGAKQLADNLSLAARMAANYEGREDDLLNSGALSSDLMPGPRPNMTMGDLNALSGYDWGDLFRGSGIRQPRGSRSGGGGSTVEEFITLFPQLEQQMEEYNETLQKAEANYDLLQEALESGLISQEDYKQKMLEVEAQFGSLGKEMEKIGDLAQEISNTVGSELNSAFSSVVRGTATVSEALTQFAQNVLIEIAEQLFDKMITQPLVKSLGGALGGISLTNANGNAFNESGVVPFAKGGVVSSPQLFAFGNGGRLGVMGEAGPEAILPLARGPGGKLGVRSSGNSPVNVVVNNYSTEQAEVKQNGQDLEIIIGRVISRDIQSGGPTYRAMRRTFGLQQPTTVRG